MRRYRVICDVVRGERGGKINIKGFANDVLHEDRIKRYVEDKLDAKIRRPYQVRSVRVKDGKDTIRSYDGWMVE